MLAAVAVLLIGGICPAQSTTEQTMTLQSDAFAMNGKIPTRYTGEGEDISPALQWSQLPQGTRELALIVDDPDAPRPEPWVHWIICKIPPETTGLRENIPTDPELDRPKGAIQGTNTWKKIGYGGPYPPVGHGVHHYHFKLYALDQPLDVTSGIDKAALLKAMQGHVLAETELIGTYQR